MKIKASLELPKDLVKSVGLDEGGKVQKYIDSFVLYHSEPYVPGKHIHDSGVVATKIGSGKVIWDTPDANYLYEGKLMVDPITLNGAFFAPDYGFWSRPNTQKIMDPTGRDLVYHGGGLRGSHWFDRMIENEMDDLLDGIVKLIGGNNGK